MLSALRSAMPKTDEGVKPTLKLPEHVLAVLEGWASSELGSAPQDVAQALIEELCVARSCGRSPLVLVGGSSGSTS